MKKTTRISIVIFALCSLLSIFAVPAMAWDWPCPDDCYYWTGYDCVKTGECGVADPCPDDVHYSCIDCECICDADPYYTAHTVIDPVSITSPTDGESFCVGTDDVSATCTPSTDLDIYHHCVDNVWTEEPEADPVTHTWTAKRDSTDVGTFPNGNTGTSVDWQPPNSAGPVTVKVTATDSPLYDDSLVNPDPTDSITVYVVEVEIEADVKDEPPPEKSYASGINENSIVLKLNEIEVTPTITNITNGKHIYYKPACSELNLPGNNTVELKVRDNANAGKEPDQNINDAGNPTSPDPFTWSFTLP